MQNSEIIWELVDAKRQPFEALSDRVWGMASIILTAAGLGFLGLGAQPPSPEWGAMLASGREFILTNGWIAGIPGLAILVTSLAFNLFGDGLRDILDPRLAER